jgi:hypothetical protein
MSDLHDDELELMKKIHLLDDASKLRILVPEELNKFIIAETTIRSNFKEKTLDEKSFLYNMKL